MEWEDRIGRRLTLRDLRLLLAAIDAGSLSKAAARLRVSQPAISKTITGIERAVGARLLTRSSKGIAPTGAGLALLARTRAAFRELRAGVDAMNGANPPRAGELRIAANQVALSGIVPAVISRMHARAPGIVFNVVPAHTFAEQISALEQEKAELAVSRVARAEIAGHVSVQELFPEPFCVVAGAKNPLGRRKKLELADLAAEPWAFPAQASVTGGYMAEIFHANGLEPPQPSVAASSLQLHQWLVLESGFLAIFPSALAGSIAGMRVLPVELKQAPRSIGIMSLKHRTPSPLAAMFCEEAKAASGEFWADGN